MSESILSFFDSLNRSIHSESFVNLVNILQLVFIVASVLILIRIIFLSLQSNYLAAALERYSWYFPKNLEQPKKRKKEVWQRIKSDFYKLERENNASIAIKADDFLIAILLDMGLVGETIQDLLADLGDAKPRNISEIIRAHVLISGLRDREDGYLSHEDAERIFFIYEEALRGLGAIDNLH